MTVRSCLRWLTATVLAAAALALAAQAAPDASASGPAGQVTYFGHTAALHAPGVSHLPSTHLPRPLLHAGTTPAATVLDSRNWSGYADQACGACKLRYVEAQFSLPSVRCTGVTGLQAASFWAGLDGLASPTVEQIGVDAFCNGTTPSYVAWYEMYPQAPVVLSVPAAAGDALDASVYYNSVAGAYSLTLSDITAGVGASVSAACPPGPACQNTSAEVIAEAPFNTATGAFVPLADFGRAFLTGTRVTARNGTRGVLGTGGPLWTADQVFMFNGADELAAPGPLAAGSAGGVPSSDFPDSWKAAS